jgi:hypothetical protein
VGDSLFTGRIRREASPRNFFPALHKFLWHNGPPSRLTASQFNGPLGLRQVVDQEPTGKLALTIYSETWESTTRENDDGKGQGAENRIRMASLMRTAVALRRLEEERRQRRAEKQRRAQESARTFRKRRNDSSRSIHGRRLRHAERLRRSIAACGNTCLPGLSRSRPME